ncbi:MAG: hypothetical protein PHC61_09320, partial [Chitinivibrionales bacterium]|nr:hypothetical protein [Chitinivibrionales bacterium]
GELSTAEQVVISRAIFVNGLFSLKAIDSVNSFGAYRAEAAYTQSHLAVLFLIDKYGMSVLPTVLSAGSAAGNFWGGMNAALVLSPKEFELAYKIYLNEKYHFVFIFADGYLFWVGIVVLFLVGLIITLKKNKKRREKLERQEEQDDLERQRQKEQTENNKAINEADGRSEENL